MKFSVKDLLILTIGFAVGLAIPRDINSIYTVSFLLFCGTVCGYILRRLVELALRDFSGIQSLHAGQEDTNAQEALSVSEEQCSNYFSTAEVEAALKATAEKVADDYKKSPTRKVGGCRVSDRQILPTHYDHHASR